MTGVRPETQMQTACLVRLRRPKLQVGNLSFPSAGMRVWMNRMSAIWGGKESHLRSDSPCKRLRLNIE